MKYRAQTEVTLTCSASRHVPVHRFGDHWEAVKHRIDNEWARNMLRRNGIDLEKLTRQATAWISYTP